MTRSSVYCSNIRELGRYFRISRDKAIDLASDPSFPQGIFIDGKVFPKAQIVAWVEQHINSGKATDKATRAITHKKA
jgi:hypothetical protein